MHEDPTDSIFYEEEGDIEGEVTIDNPNGHL